MFSRIRPQESTISRQSSRAEQSLIGYRTDGLTKAWPLLRVSMRRLRCGGVVCVVAESCRDGIGVDHEFGVNQEKFGFLWEALSCQVNFWGVEERHVR